MSRVLRSPAIRAASRIACLLAASKCKGTAIVQSDGTEPSSREAVTHSWCKSIASSCVAEKCCTVPCEVTSRSSASALLNEASKRALSSAAHPAGLFTRYDTAPSPTKRRRSLKATTEGVCRREASFTSTSTPPRRGDAITEFTLPMSIPSKPEPLAPVGMVTSSRSHRAGIVAVRLALSFVSTWQLRGLFTKTFLLIADPQPVSIRNATQCQRTTLTCTATHTSP